MEKEKLFCRAAFEAELKAAQANSKKLYPRGVLSVIAIPLAFIASSAGWLPSWAIFVPIILLVIFVAQNRGAWRKVDLLARDGRLLREVLNDSFEVIEYDRHRLIEDDLLREGQFNYLWYTRFSRDYLRARYRGVDFIFADVELSIIQLQMRSRSSFSTPVTLFQGPWLVITSQKEINPAVVVSQKKSRKARKGEFPGTKPLKTKSDVQMENPAFQEKFWTFSDDQVIPYRVLTPHFMEFILSAGEVADGATHLCFTGDHVHVAIHTGRKFFSLCTKAKDFPTFRANIEKEVNYIKAIIDELLLNEQLFEPK